MNDETKSALMAFMDGELGTLSARRMANRLEQEAALRDAWETQYRVSFLLQQGRVGAALARPGFAARVQEAIAAEMPQVQGVRRGGSHWLGWSSVAAVTVLSASLFVFTPWHGGSPVGNAAAVVPMTAASAASERFSLRPVRFSVASGPLMHADVTIQRDIQRIWRPVPERYLGWAHEENVGFSQFSAPGLLPVDFRAQEGIYPGAGTHQH